MASCSIYEAKKASSMPAQARRDGSMTTFPSREDFLTVLKDAQKASFPAYQKQINHYNFNIPL